MVPILLSVFKYINTHLHIVKIILHKPKKNSKQAYQTSIIYIIKILHFSYETMTKNKFQKWNIFERTECRNHWQTVKDSVMLMQVEHTNWGTHASLQAANVFFFFFLMFNICCVSLAKAMIYSLCESQQLKSLSALVADSHEKKEKKKIRDGWNIIHKNYFNPI